ncbi:MAG: 30S ribosomal protein S16 [Deltaproteobacteria bacterium]|nr:30S ribosomal protein S16 [Deltaproteobacteria bacterium]
MAVVMRLARHGKKKQPFYRIVACDQRFPRDGRYLDIVGLYDPRAATGNVRVEMEKYQSWLQKGAKPTLRVRDIVSLSTKVV